MQECGLNHDIPLPGDLAGLLLQLLILQLLLLPVLRLLRLKLSLLGLKLPQRSALLLPLRLRL